jgi:hypothetical protein
MWMNCFAWGVELPAFRQVMQGACYTAKGQKTLLIKQLGLINNWLRFNNHTNSYRRSGSVWEATGWCSGCTIKTNSQMLCMSLRSNRWMFRVHGKKKIYRLSVWVWEVTNSCLLFAGNPKVCRMSGSFAWCGGRQLFNPGCRCRSRNDWACSNNTASNPTLPYRVVSRWAVELLLDSKGRGRHLLCMPSAPHIATGSSTMFHLHRHD